MTSRLRSDDGYVVWGNVWFLAMLGINMLTVFVNTQASA